jgi:drug/metabolite transporter (DMT)-like permease
MFLGAIFLHESITINFAIGALLILSAMLLRSFSGKK